MKKITKRDKQTIQFLKWINKYPGWWQLICTPDDEHMNIKMMDMLIRHLAQEQLYEIIFVLLMVHRNEMYVKDALNSMLLDMMTENWGGKKKDRKQMIKAILKHKGDFLRLLLRRKFFPKAKTPSHDMVKLYVN